MRALRVQPEGNMSGFDVAAVERAAAGRSLRLPRSPQRRSGSAKFAARRSAARSSCTTFASTTRATTSDTSNWNNAVARTERASCCRVRLGTRSRPGWSCCSTRASRWPSAPRRPRAPARSQISSQRWAGEPGSRSFSSRFAGSFAGARSGRRHSPRALRSCRSMAQKRRSMRR